MFERKSHLTTLIFAIISLVLFFGCSNEPDKITEVKETPA